MSGFGSMAMGTTPYGLGTPNDGEAPPTGTAGSRWINPQTKDYEQDPDTKQLKQMPPVRQRVLLALLTLYASSSVLRTFGVRLPKKMGTLFDAQAKSAVRVALAQLTDIEQVISIDSIVVERGAGGRAAITVSYTDLTTGEDDSVTT